jgi:histone acetyltransferase 1
MQEIEKWITPANTAVTLQLAAQDGTVQKFHPAITESIFIHDDQLIGYKEPKIDITFRSNDLRPSVKISFKQKAPSEFIAQIKNGEDLVDLQAPLKDFFPDDAFQAPRTDDTITDWKPPGEKLHSYTHDGKIYEVWSTGLGDKKAIQILKNMKILIPMFIEGGTVDFLNDDDVPENRWTIERWRLFLLYEVNKSIYSLAGFSTSYHLPVLPTDSILKSLPSKTLGSSPNITEVNDIAAAIPADSQVTNGDTSFAVNSISQYPARERISQFIILPPYQGSCHGIQLYNTVTSEFLANPFIFQITVEDPNESFDNLRDYCDLARLYADPQFSSLTLPESIPSKELHSHSIVPIALFLTPTLVEELCKRHKLIPRQVQRLIELHLLRSIPASSRSVARIVRKSATGNIDDRKFYFWRLLVKHRVWVRNHEELAQVDEMDRVPKVDSAADALLEQYQDLIEGFDRRLSEGLVKIEGQVTSGGAEQSSSSKYTGRKRKVVSEEDSDDSDEAPAKRLATEELLGSGRD